MFYSPTELGDQLKKAFRSIFSKKVLQVLLFFYAQVHMHLQAQDANISTYGLVQ